MVLPLSLQFFMNAPPGRFYGAPGQKNFNFQVNKYFFHADIKQISGCNFINIYVKMTIFIHTLMSKNRKDSIMHNRQGLIMQWVFLFLLISSLAVFARVEYTWNGGSGSWGTAGNWTPAGVPGAGDGVTITTGTVSLDADRTVARITLSGSGVLHANANLTITESFTFSNGLLMGDTLTAALDDTVWVTDTATMTLSTTSKKDIDNVAIIVQGTASWTAGNIDLDATNTARSALFKNEGTFTINLPDGRSMQGGPTTTLENASVVNFTTTTGGRTQINVNFLNNGTVNVNAGNLEFRDISTSTGATYNTASGALTTFTIQTHVMDSVTVTGSGTLELKDTPLTLNGDGLAVASGATFNVNGSGSTIQGTGPLVVDGTMQWDRGRITGSGSFTNNNVLNITGSNPKNLGRALVNKGTTTWSGGEIDLESGGSITNDSTATFNFTSGAKITRVSGTGQFTNLGTVTKNSGGTSIWNAPLTNRGTFNVLTDSLQVTDPVVNDTGGVFGGTGFYDFTDLGASLTNNGKFAPGTSPGLLTFVGTYPQTSSQSDLNIELGGTTPGTGYDQMVVKGQAQLGGTLNLSVIDGFTPATTDTFVVMKFTSRSGQFSAVSFPNYNHNVFYTDTTVFVTGVELANVAPVANADQLTIDEDNTGTINVLANDSDADADPLTITGFTQPTNGTVTQLGDSSFTYQPPANFAGADTFSYNISDGQGGTATGTVTVTVNAVNDAPVVSGIPDVTFKEDSSATLDLTQYASDVDNDSTELTWSATVISAQPPAGKNSATIEVDPSDLTVTFGAGDVATFSATADSGGVFTVVLTATDPGPLSDSDTITVTVTSVDDPPVVASAIEDVSFNEDTGPIVVANLDTVFNDPDPNTTLIYSVQSDNADILVSMSGAILMVNASANFSGSGTVTVTASDGSSTAEDQFGVTVTPVNDAPVINPPLADISFPEDSSTTLDLSTAAGDVDNDTTDLSWSAAVLTASGTVKNADGSVTEVDVTDLTVTIDANNIATFSATADSGGVFTVEFTVTDPGALSDKDTITVTVTGVNDPPVRISTISDVVFNEDTGPVVAADLSTIFSDADPGTNLTYSAVSDNADILTPIAGTILSVDAAPNAFGSAVVVVTASDGFASASDTFHVTVAPVNDAPLADLPDISFPEDGSAAVDLDKHVSDVDNDTTQLIWSATVLTASGTVKNADGSVTEVDVTDLTVSIDANHVATFSATADSGGVFTVEFTVTDPGALSDKDTITVTVTGVNDPPVRISTISDVVFNEDTGPVVAADLSTIFSDADPGTNLTYSAVSDNADILTPIAGTILSVDAAPNAFGSAVVVVTASDGFASASDTFHVTVAPVNDAPQLVNWPAAFQFLEDDSLSFNLDTLIADVDNSFDELTIEFAASDTTVENHVELNIDPVTHVVTLVPEPNFFILGVQIIVTVSDPDGLSDTLTVNLDILPVNDAPYFLVDLEADTIKQDSSTSGNIWEIVEDVETPDNELLFIFSTSSPDLGVSYNDQTGDVTLTPAPGFTGMVDLFITVSDGELSAKDTLHVYVEPATGIGDPDGNQLPTTFDVAQNYPNPFNPSTTVKFQLPQASDVRLTIYNMLGQRVRTLLGRRMEAGYHEVEWDGRNDAGVQQATGLYIYRFEAGGFVKILKMTLIK